MTTATPMHSYAEVLASIDHLTYEKLMEEHIQDLSAQIILESNKVTQKQPPPTLSKLNQAMENINKIKAKMQRMNEVNGVARDVFILQERLDLLTGMRLPIINVLLECVMVSMYYRKTSALNGRSSHYTDGRGKPIALRVLSRADVIHLNATISQYTATVYASRPPRGSAECKLTTEEIGILQTVLLVAYLQLGMY